MRMPGQNRLFAVALLGVLFLGFSRTPQAAPSTAPLSEADEDRLLQSSIARVKEQLALGNPAQALSILVETYGRVPTPALLWPIVELQIRLSHPKEARAALDKYVAQVPPNKMPKGQQLGDVERLREELHKQFGRLELAAVAPGAEVTIDGEALDVAARSEPALVNPGSHRLELRQGGRTVTREVRVLVGQTLRVDLQKSAQTGDGELFTGDSATGARRPRPVRTAAYVLGGIGIAGIVVGSVLWGLDGMQSCPQAPMCHFALDSKATGIGLLSAGVGLGSAALILGIIDARSHRTGAVSRPD
jgi:hypothetical protein